MVLAAALALIVLPVLTFSDPMANSGDARVYAAEMDIMFGGAIPYLDFRFEHLPLAIVPMAAAHAVAILTGLPFTYPFMIIMLAMTFVTGMLVARIGDELGLGDAGQRWVIMVAPMLLIIPFRIDALSVILTVAAVFYAIGRRETASLTATIGGILSKGWPVILAATDWWRGERRPSQPHGGVHGVTLGGRQQPPSQQQRPPSCRRCVMTVRLPLISPRRRPTTRQCRRGRYSRRISWW